MTRFESPTQVVLLFTGAALVSMVLIVLLNAEANNRKIHKEPEIVNGNLFTSLGRGVGRLIRGWTQGNHTREASTTRTQGIGGGDNNRARRSLKSLGGREFDSLQHPVRHAKHKTRQQTQTTTTTPTATTTTTSPLAEEVQNFTVAKNETSRIVTKRRLDLHDACYNTQEVLLIITITCGVNFAFVFFVMVCVRACSRNNKVEDSYIPCNGDSPTLPDDGLGNYKSYSTAREYCNSASGSYNSVQEYVDSLPQVCAGSMLSLHSLYTQHIPDHPGRNNRRKSKNSLHTAYSMEDLLLM